MSSSKTAIVQRDGMLRAQISRELILATLKDPGCWDACWKPLLLVHIVLRHLNLPSLQGHPYVYERWWSHDDSVGASGVNLKVLLANGDGTSVILLGTSVWDTEESSSARWVCSPAFLSSYMENEASLQLQRFFSHQVNPSDEVRMKSVVVSCCDDDVKDMFHLGVRELERSWRNGIPFTF